MLNTPVGVMAGKTPTFKATKKPEENPHRAEINQLNKSFKNKIGKAALVGGAAGAVAGTVIGNPIGGAFYGAELASGGTAIQDMLQRRSNDNPHDKTARNTVIAGGIGGLTSLNMISGALSMTEKQFAAFKEATMSGLEMMKSAPKTDSKFFNALQKYLSTVAEKPIEKLSKMSLGQYKAKTLAIAALAPIATVGFYAMGSAAVKALKNHD